MTTETSQSDTSQARYRTGAAARLAGIRAETLRVWERRYRVVGPTLTSSGHRRYSADDVARLVLLKNLVDIGHPIGSIANLPLDALRQMRTESAAADDARPTPASASQRLRVALMGTSLAERLVRESALLPTLDIVATFPGVEQASSAMRDVAADILVVELPALAADVAARVDDWVRAVGARHAIVEYRFAPGELIASLRRRGHEVARAPLGARELEQLCRTAMAPRSLARNAPAQPLLPEVIPSRRLGDEALARMARASATLYCECPRHVVDLLMSLTSFEHYSAECADRNAADAALHRYLQRVAGCARALFEDALVRVARAEGITLPEEAGGSNGAP
jgi:DNA-binding transcriptional MerR regulator